MKKIILFLVLSVLLTGCNANANIMKGTDQTGRIAYESDELHFSIVIPENWKDKYNFEVVENETGHFVVFYNVANRNAGMKLSEDEAFYGELFVIQKLDRELWEYYEQEILADLPVKFLDTDDEYAYIMDMANVPEYTPEDYDDIQYSQTDEALKEEYLEMAKDIEAIADSFELMNQE